jgi:hypothetical protein
MMVGLEIVARARRVILAHYRTEMQTCVSVTLHRREQEWTAVNEASSPENLGTSFKIQASIITTLPPSIHHHGPALSSLPAAATRHPFYRHRSPLRLCLSDPMPRWWWFLKVQKDVVRIISKGDDSAAAKKELD